MKKTINILILIIVFILLIGNVYAGHVPGNPYFKLTQEPSFFEKIFGTGFETYIPDKVYQPGQTISKIATGMLFNQACTNAVLQILPNKNGQDFANYGYSLPIGQLNNQIFDDIPPLVIDGPSSYVTTFVDWTLPPSIQSGTWIIKTYLTCSGTIISDVDTNTILVGSSLQCTPGQTVGNKFCRGSSPGDYDVVQLKYTPDCDVVDVTLEICEENCENGVCISIQQTSCVNDLGGDICTAEEICGLDLITTADTNKCCLGSCYIEQTGGGNNNGSGMAIGVDFSKYKKGTITKEQLKNSACDSTTECKTGRCIDLATQEELKSVLGLPCTFGVGIACLIDKFISRSSPDTSKEQREQIAQTTSEALSETGKQGICFTNFVPTDNEENLLPPETLCAKPYTPQENIPILNGLLGTAVGTILGYDFKIPGTPRCAISLTN